VSLISLALCACFGVIDGSLSVRVLFFLLLVRQPQVCFCLGARVWSGVFTPTFKVGLVGIIFTMYTVLARMTSFCPPGMTSFYTSLAFPQRRFCTSLTFAGA